ncbi:MAG: hypothetical protein QOE03_228 [Micromonosporaceae bacterium]|nr:hypothetical protein [Micromonosporaceae bacterium]
MEIAAAPPLTLSATYRYGDWAVGRRWCRRPARGPGCYSRSSGAVPSSRPRCLAPSWRAHRRRGVRAEQIMAGVPARHGLDQQVRRVSSLDNRRASGRGRPARLADQTTTAEGRARQPPPAPPRSQRHVAETPHRYRGLRGGHRKPAPSPRRRRYRCQLSRRGERGGRRDDGTRSQSRPDPAAALPRSRHLKFLWRDEYPTPAERRWRVDHGIHPSRAGVERKPELIERAGICPCRSGPIVPASYVLGECRQEHIPMLVARARRLRLKQAVTRLDRLPPVLFQELGDQPPPRGIVGARQQGAQPRQGHRLVNLMTFLHAQDRNSPAQRSPRYGVVRVDLRHARLRNDRRVRAIDGRNQ